MPSMFRIVSVFTAAAATLVVVPAAKAQSPTCAGTPQAGHVRLTVIATELRNAQGEVAITVYPNDAKRFLAKGGKLFRSRVSVRAPDTTACFWVAPGQYAVATYHDENGDHNFNRTLFAIKEGFGFSNDAPTTLGLPRFERVRFAAARDTVIRVRTRYSR